MSGLDRLLNFDMEKKFTAYCGLCCLDCIPSNTEFFSLIERLERMLEELQFDEYAKLKSKKQSLFNEYPMFIKILREIKDLRFAFPCREGGGSQIARFANASFIMGLMVTGSVTCVGLVSF